MGIHEYHKVHLKAPILEIWTTHKMLVELFEQLKMNGVKISTFDKNYEEDFTIISIEDGAFHVSIEQEAGEDSQIISFYESDSSLHPHLLHDVLNFAQKNDLKIINNKISMLHPKDYPPPTFHG